MAINERVNITVTSNGTVRVKKELGDIGREARKSAEGVDMLKGVLTGWLSGNALATLAKYADTYTNINNRLKIVTKSTEELTTAQNQLYRIAQDTYQSFESTATIFARTATATKALGMSSKQAMMFTRQLSQSVALSGVSAESANAALIQLSQGLASGTLRGEELNSLLEQLPYAAQTLAKGLNITVGELRNLGQQGLITPKQIINAFNRMSAQIDADFKKMTPTISQGLQVLQNGFVQLLGVLETNVGIFGLVGSGLALIGNNLGVVMVALTPVILALTAFAVQTIAGFLIPAIAAGTAALITFATAMATFAVTALTAAIGGVISLTGAIGALTVAILSNPITWIIGAVIALGVVVLKLTGYFDTVKEYVMSWAKSILEYINGVIDAVKKLLGLTGKTEKATANQNFGSGGGGAGSALNKTAKDLETSIAKGGKTAAETMAERQKKADEAGADMLAKSYGSSSQSAADTMEDGMTRGGRSAGASMSDAIVSAGNKAATVISQASIGGKSSGMSSRISMDQFAKSKTVGMSATTGVANSNTRSGGSDPASPYSPAFANGGGMRVGGSGGTDSQVVQFRATPNEHVTVETPAQRRASQNNAPVVVPAPQVQVINRVDPRGQVDAMRSGQGQKATTNNIRANAEEIRRILGVR